MFPINASITISPVFYKDAPIIRVCVNDTEIFNGNLIKNKTFEFNNTVTNGLHNISVQFFNKTDSDYDAENNLDKAVIIEQVRFYDIISDYALLNSEYEPNYSESYINTLKETNSPINKKVLGCNYLGWNGIWKTSFSTPIFTWIHKTENLGWIYPSNNRF